MQEDKVIEIKDKIIEIKVAIEGIEQAVKNIAYTEEKVDWEQRRYEIAKMTMAAIVSRCAYDCNIAARASVQYTDALIAELKKKE